MDLEDMPVPTEGFKEEVSSERTGARHDLHDGSRTVAHLAACDGRLSQRGGSVDDLRHQGA